MDNKYLDQIEKELAEAKKSFQEKIEKHKEKLKNIQRSYFCVSCRKTWIINKTGDMNNYRCDECNKQIDGVQDGRR